MSKKENIEIEYVEASLENTLEEMKNRRDYLKKVMKPAEEASKDLENATATEKVRLQGTKEPKVPSLKPYTEALDVKDRHELGKLISGAKKDGRPWTVKRCTEEKLKEGYRYTFFTNKVAEVFTESLDKVTEAKEEPLEEVPVDLTIEEPIEAPVELSPNDLEIAPIESCDDCSRAIEILKGRLNFHPGEKEGTFVICLMDEEGKEKECIELKDLGEDELAALNMAFIEPKQEEPKEEEEIVDVELTESKEKEEEEPKLETFDEQMDFLAADEQEAIDGYEKVLGLVEDEHVKEQLQHIMDEERAHKDFLEKVKEDRSLVYSHEEQEEEHEEESEEEIPSDELVDLNVGLELEEPVDELKEDVPGKKLIRTVNSCVDAADLASELDAQNIKYEFADTGLFVDEKDFNRAEAILLDMEDNCELDEASSAEKRAFRNGGEDFDNLIRGKALARIKDPHERAMLLHQHRMEKAGRKMSDRPEVDATLARHIAQSERDFEKKELKMANDGLAEDLVWTPDSIANEIVSALDYTCGPGNNPISFEDCKKMGELIVAQSNSPWTSNDIRDLVKAIISEDFNWKYVLPDFDIKVEDVEREALEEGVKISLDDLTLFKPWGGAKDIWDLIVAQDKIAALDAALEDMYPEGITATDLNDILWFEKDWVIDSIDLKPFTIRDDAIEVEPTNVRDAEPSEEEA